MRKLLFLWWLLALGLTQAQTELQNSCFESNLLGNPNCSDDECELLVCIERPQCCSDNYNGACVGIALDVCPLPKGDNTCFETSENPGCLENMVCLDAVCQVYSDCCGKQYGDQCVNAARNNPNTCIPWAANNKCNATSPVGGCTDSDCEKLVCKINPECCNSPLRTGEWSQACVDVAADVCPT